MNCVTYFNNSVTQFRAILQTFTLLLAYAPDSQYKLAVHQVDSLTITTWSLSEAPLFAGTFCYQNLLNKDNESINYNGFLISINFVNFLYMKQDGTITPHAPTTLNVLLADDDSDDRHFFEKVLKALPIPTRLVTVEDGEKLMTYLSENSKKLPDILFLDLNMPKKNGSECLLEIKQNEKLKRLPVIIYSTHMHEKDAALLYHQGAHYYIRKTDMIELAKVLYRILNRMVVNKFARPEIDKFIFTMETV